MGQFFESIPPNLVSWINAQQLFWVATAPLSPDGHVNVSPKGIRGSFKVVNENKVWYQDLSGSGVETVAHLRENGRITIMFNAFEGPPRIVRLFGRGTVHEFGTPEYDALIPVQNRKPGSRAAIVIDVHKVGTSCGYAVPYFDFKSHRTTLLDFFVNREAADQPSDPSKYNPEKGLKAYWKLKNSTNHDGLPGLTTAIQSSVLPECFYDKEAEGRPAVPAAAAISNGDVGFGATEKWGVVDLKFLGGLSLGVVLSAIYVRVMANGM